MTTATASDGTAEPLEGGCLCGAVRYTARPPKREGYWCHCRMCQRAFGNTRAPFLNLPKANVAWTSGAPTYYASSSFALRGFCGRCGTPLSFEYLDSEVMDLSVGSLDDPSAVRPVLHSGVESRIANWHADDGLPEERLDDDASLAERWRRARADADLPPRQGESDPP